MNLKDTQLNKEFDETIGYCNKNECVDLLEIKSFINTHYISKASVEEVVKKYKCGKHKKLLKLLQGDKCGCACHTKGIWNDCHYLNKDICYGCGNKPDLLSKRALLDGAICHDCGGPMKPSPTTNTCPKCWEEN